MELTTSTTTANRLRDGDCIMGFRSTPDRFIHTAKLIDGGGCADSIEVVYEDDRYPIRELLPANYRVTLVHPA